MDQKLVFLFSHPIQYFAPLLKELESSKRFRQVVAWYCSTKGVEESHDREFGVAVKWDIPLLEGYTSEFLQNYGYGEEGFWSLFNPAVLKRLRKETRAIVVVHGWNYATHLFTLLFARMFGHQVALHGETPLNQELRKTSKRRWWRNFFFRRVLFPRVDYFLYIGEQNRAFYKHYGVKDSKLIFTPYAIDNERFRHEAERLRSKKMKVREQWKVPVNKRVVLYSGKFIPKKKPLDLVYAATKLREEDCFFIFMGEGALRNEMEEVVAEHKLENVMLTGFVNQSKVSELYALADIFVMCSQDGETWGLSTNEAMNFGLPIIVSDLTGCCDDLVIEGVTGYSFLTGDVDDLVAKLEILLNLPEEEFESFRRAARTRVDSYSFRVICRNLDKHLITE